MPLAVVPVDLLTLGVNVRTVTLFPAAAAQSDEAESILERYGAIVSQKTVQLNPRNAVNLIRQMYAGEGWTGDHTDLWSGVQYKAARCFPNDLPTRVYLVAFPDNDRARSCKETIRERCGVDKHAVHIDDTRDASLRTARILLNQNSLHCVNHADYIAYSGYRSFFTMLTRFAEWVSEHGHAIEDFCFGGTSPLSAYGLREDRNLEFLYAGGDIGTGIAGMNCLGAESKLYGHDKDGIIQNPDNHFWFENVKFCSLNVTRTMMVRRNSPEDRLDLVLIDRVL